MCCLLLRMSNSRNLNILNVHQRIRQNVCIFILVDVEIWIIMANFFANTSCIVLHETAWWRHQMETFSASLAICAGDSPVPGEFPTQRPVTRNFDVLFDLRLNKRLSKQWRGWWLETLSRPLWRHRSGLCKLSTYVRLHAVSSHQGCASESGQHLVQIMTCRLFDTKPLSNPMLGYCQLDH